MKLEVGKRYVRRDGKVTGPLGFRTSIAWPFYDTLNVFAAWTEDGRCSIGGPSDFDLVAEYTPVVEAFPRPNLFQLVALIALVEALVIAWWVWS